MLERYSPPSILVAPDNRLAHLSEHAGRYLLLPGGDVTLSAVRLVREELRIELQGLLQSARETKQLVDSRPIPVRFNGHPVPVVMHVRPAQDVDQQGFVLVIFEEHQPPAEKPESNTNHQQVALSAPEQVATRIAELEAELSAARQRLQATIEEYETSQEEMKASGEEMQSTNEELRSTLEELETSKEELQSINEELQTVNQENRHKVEELSQLSSDIQNLLTSTEIATLFLDRELRIMRFTARLADLFSIRVADRGRPISDLTHRLGYSQLSTDAYTVLDRLVPIEREIRDEAGRWYLTRVLPYRSTEDRIEGVVITFVEITDRKLAENALRESEQLRRVALAGGRMGTWRWDLRERLVSGDAQFLALWGFPPSDHSLPLSVFTERMSPKGSAEMETIVTRAIASGEEFDGPLEIVSGPTAGRWVQWRGRAGADDKSVLYGVTFDITEQKRVETQLRDDEERQAFLLKLTDALRPLSEPLDIQIEAMRKLGEYLKVSRVQYYELESDGEHVVTHGGFSGDLPAFVGRLRMHDFGPHVKAALDAGRTLSDVDAQANPQLTPTEVAAYDAIGVRAYLGVPLVKNGRLVALLGLHDSSPHNWTPLEVGLVEDVAERTWAAVERARAEAALTESEKKYRILFEEMSEGFCLGELRRDETGRAIDLRYILMNPALEKHTGMNVEVSTGRWFEELFPGIDRSRWLSMFQEVVDTQIPRSFEEYWPPIDRWLAGTASPAGNGRYTIFYQDVSERKRNELALRESEERYRTLFERMEEGFAILERIGLGKGERRDFRYVLTNPAWSRHTGYASSDGYTVLQLTPGMDSFIFDRFDEALRTGHSQIFETQITTRKLWVHAEAFAAGPSNQVAVIFSKINERKQAEQILSENDERRAFLLMLSDSLRALFEAEQIRQTACRILGEHLAVDRAAYGEMLPDGKHMVTAGGYMRAGVHSVAGTYRISDFGAFFTDIDHDLPAVMDDAHSDTTVHSIRNTWDKLGIRAGMAYPVVKRGRLVAAIYVHSILPRRWTETEKSLLAETGERIWEAMERAHAERALRQSEERQAFLLKLSDALRPIADPVEVQRAAMRALGEYLHVNRALYMEVHSDRDTLQAGPAYASGVNEMPRNVRLSDFDSKLFAHYLSGETVVTNDFLNDSEFGTEHEAAFAAIQVRAAIGVPLIKAGELVSVLTVHQSEVRLWTPMDVQLVEEVAQRTWAAVERAHAEFELRESENRQAFLLALSDTMNALEDPIEIQQAVMKAVGEYLGLSRAFYFRVESDEDGWLHVIDSEYRRIPDLPAMIGRHSLKNFGSGLFEKLAHGSVLQVDDVAALQGVTPAELSSYQAVRVAAFLNVPLRRTGEYSAGITAHDVAPRAWKPEEINLLREVGQRTWEALERAGAEEALRQSEERLRQFGEASQDCLWIRNADTLQWEYLTPAFETIYGLDREAALRGDNMASWLELIVLEDRDYAATSLQRVQSGESVTFEYRIQRPADGCIRWLRNTDFPIKDAAGQVAHIGGVGHDITAMKEAGEALAAAEARQRALLEGMPQLVWRARDGGMWTWASPQWTNYTGQAEEQSHGWGWLDPVYPGDREIAQKAWSTAMETGGFEVEYRLLDAGTQTYRWFQTRATPVRDSSGSIIEWLGTSTDVEGMKQTEAALREAEEKFRLFVENVQEYALVQTDSAGAITNWNPGAQRLFGYPPEQMVGQDFSSVLTAEDQERGVFRAELATGGVGQRSEDARWLVRRDGSRFWARWISEPILDSTGQFVGVAKIMRDETERERAETFTRHSLAEKEELLKEVHHRVKNNLQVIISLLNMQMFQIEEERVLALFQEARNRVLAISSIHELLYRADSFANIKLTDYARQLVPGLVRFYGLEEGVRVDIVGDGATLELERAVPYGMLLNELVSNACKHAFPSSQTGTLTISVQPDGRDIVLTVSDTGPGLPVGFDYRKASSLGLKLVHGLVRQVHGTLEISSPPGTTVKVRFPMAGAEPDE